MCRPTKLSEDVEKAVCDAIREGATFEAASASAGIAYSTFNEWRKDDRPKYVKFSEAVSRAEADAQLWHIRNINRQSKQDWRASAWMLERRFSRDYGTKQALDVTSGGEKIKAYIGINPDDWDKDEK